MGMAMGPGGATRVSFSSLATVVLVVAASAVLVVDPDVGAAPDVVVALPSVVSVGDDPQPAINRDAASDTSIRAIATNLAGKRMADWSEVVIVLLSKVHPLHVYALEPLELAVEVLGLRTEHVDQQQAAR
jgi:hypothetical protein